MKEYAVRTYEVDNEGLLSYTDGNTFSLSGIQSKINHMAEEGWVVKGFSITPIDEKSQFKADVALLSSKHPSYEGTIKSSKKTYGFVVVYEKDAD